MRSCVERQAARPCPVIQDHGGRADLHAAARRIRVQRQGFRAQGHYSQSPSGRTFNLGALICTFLGIAVNGKSYKNVRYITQGPALLA